MKMTEQQLQGSASEERVGYHSILFLSYLGCCVISIHVHYYVNVKKTHINF